MNKLISKSLLLLLSLILFQCSGDDDTNENPETPSETVTDADGNVYETITIGNQIWMAENLKTTKFNDGSPITLYTFDEFGNNWSSFNEENELYQWSDTSDLNNVVDQELAFDAYGAMYNHFAVDSGKLAPEGWRIPSQEDFMALESFLENNGSSGNVATALKSETDWFDSVGNGTNASGFNALPNGYVSGDGTATLANGVATFATTSGDFTGTIGLQRRILVQLEEDTHLSYSSNALQIGAGVRCIKIQ